MTDPDVRLSPLTPFHPLIAEWFVNRVGTPTDIQAKSWGPISDGDHVLITAPTGSGKTLTAFLWALNQLVTGAWKSGATSVLYVSPLKALNNDIRRNLITPLEQLREWFEEVGEPFPLIRALTRSGDTPQADRRRMLRNPPEILITTPESLNLLLSSAGGRSMLTDLRTVILDEIHAVVESKRGTYLMTAVERLVRLSGEFQRIALSATVRPMATVGEFVGGFRLDGHAHDPTYDPRHLRLIRSDDEKRYEVKVRFPPESDDESQNDEDFWTPLIADFKEIIRRNRSTLLFTNARRLAETITLRLNADEDTPIAYAHHGSLSREVREEVEAKLKEGGLKAIVATGSLEMGIDIGALDEVVLIQAPNSISSAIQRVGRAGHQVGETSRATLYPTHPRNFLDAATLAPAILAKDIEPVKPIRGALDVLSQVIVSMTGTEMWDIDELYAELRASYPFHELNRHIFDQVLNMLAGRYSDTRIRELQPRVSVDRMDNTVVARKGALQALYMSGGVIPDRGYYQMRHHQSQARIAELDEEFVFENGEGSVFGLGQQVWRVEKVTNNDVFVSPASAGEPFIPFWRAEGINRNFHFSSRRLELLEKANARLFDDSFLNELIDHHHMDATSAESLIEFLRRQHEATGVDLPHRHHLVIETMPVGPEGAPAHQMIFHTMWGGAVNRPFAMALAGAWEERYGVPLQHHVDNETIAFMMTEEAIDPAELLSLISSATLESHLRRQLESSGYFGARFREAAGRAMLVTRNKMGQRMPLWLTRKCSQNLMQAVMNYEDFPILLETWRTCLQDEFDMDALRTVMTELEEGVIQWTHAETLSASPFAKTQAWRTIFDSIYLPDLPPGGRASKLRSDLIQEVVFSPGLRPRITRMLIRDFERKRHRLFEGYSPQTPRDLLDWVGERLLIPQSEWEALLDAMKRDHGVNRAELLEPLGEKLVVVAPKRANEPLVATVENTPRLLDALYTDEDPTVTLLNGGDIQSLLDLLPDLGEDDEEDPSGILGEWLTFYGPRTETFIADTLGIERIRLQFDLEDLIEGQRVIIGQLIDGYDDDAVCDAQNFEILLRLTRRDAAPAFQALPMEQLPLFLAMTQGLVEPEEGTDGLFKRVEQLACYPARAGLWESEILPARVQPYATALLDSIMQEGELRWLGGEGKTITFCFDGDDELIAPNDVNETVPLSNQFLTPLDTLSHRERAGVRANGRGVRGEEATSNDDLSDLFRDETGRYDFGALLGNANTTASQLSERLWNAVWQGRITNDTFASLRKGIQTNFKAPEASGVARQRNRAPSRRARLSRWKGSIPFAGSWYRVEPPLPPDGLLDGEERTKDRVRLLLDRYGVLFRELLMREHPAMQWSQVFRSLRLMELSGEVLAGHFFEEVPGPQFTSHAAFRTMQRALPEDAVYWINATDPASLCGMPLDSVRGSLPKRVPSNHLVYRGATLVLTSERNGKDLAFHIDADDPNINQYLAVLRHLMHRDFEPESCITVETINGEDAARSPYVDALRTSFEAMIDFKKVILYRRVA